MTKDKLKVVISGLLNKFGSSTSIPIVTTLGVYTYVIEYNISGLNLVQVNDELHEEMYGQGTYLLDMPGPTRVYNVGDHAKVVQTLVKYGNKLQSQQDVALKIIEELSK